MRKPKSLASPERECIQYSLLILSLVVLSSWSQNCSSKEDPNKCCMGYWYDSHYNQCSKCPNGYYGLNCSMVCPYPNFGELCRYKCNCTSAYCHPTKGCYPEGSAGRRVNTGNNDSSCSTNYWYKEDRNECVECNQGYFGTNCTELCPFPFYGVVCSQTCNCSVDDCHYATGCPVLQIETNGTTSHSEKRDTFNRKRLNLRMGVFVFGGILIVFVLLFLLIELRRRTRQSVVEQQIYTENGPTYAEIQINEEHPC